MPRASLEIDIAKLKKNFKTLIQWVAPSEIMAVVKADAYGLGAKTISPVLKDAGASFLAVATVNEALELPDCGLPIQILGNILQEEIPTAVSAGLICPVADFANAAQIDSEARKQNKIIPIAVPVDTGMGRIGMLVPNVYDTVVKIHNELQNLKIFGIYSHLVNAWKIDDDFTLKQIDELKKIYQTLTASGINIPHVYISASNGISNYKQSFSAPFNIVRSGINMYGFTETPENLNLEEVAEFKSKIIAIRELPENHNIGYNRLYSLPKKSRVGTIAAGYADGVPLALTNRGRVLVHGISVPVAGRVSMDYTTVLLDDVPEAKVGDEVVFFGKQKDAVISINELSELKKTHPHDLLCAIGKRVKRIYKNMENLND